MTEKIKNAVRWTNVVEDVEIVRTFYEKEFQKQIRKSVELKKQWGEKVLKYMLNGKATITLLTVGLIKKISLYKNELFFRTLYP